MNALALGRKAPARTVRLGTRGSLLARTQAGLVEAAMRGLGLDVETVLVETTGDRRKPDTAWGEGAFVKELESALLDRRIDVAVHSAKDLPTRELPGLAITAYLPRADPRDALVCRDPAMRLDTLPAGARIGTDSPRRTAFLLAHRPDLQLHPLHGNVDTRLRRLDEGQSDALVLALAGLARLGREEHVSEILPTAILPPAPGQGALAVQVRSGDELAESLRAIDDRPTRLAVEAEREFLRLSGGGCRAPIGALAEVNGSSLTMRAGYARADGSAVAFAEASGGLGDGAVMAAAVVDELVVRIGPRASLERPRVLVTRPGDRSDALEAALRERGLEPVNVPTIEIVEGMSGGGPAAAIDRIADYDWILVTSANGAHAIARALAEGRAEGIRCAAVGQATADALASHGLSVDYVPERADAISLAEGLPIRGGERILVARAASGTPGLVEALGARGATVDEVAVYETVEGPESSRAPLARALSGDGVRAIVFASGSSVRGLLRLAPADALDGLLGLPAVCIGQATNDAARKAGFRRVLTAGDTRPATLAELARSAVDADEDAEIEVGSR